jgi:hypothetical protein
VRCGPRRGGSGAAQVRREQARGSGRSATWRRVRERAALAASGAGPGSWAGAGVGAGRAGRRGRERAVDYGGRLQCDGSARKLRTSVGDVWARRRWRRERVRCGGA